MEEIDVLKLLTLLEAEYPQSFSKLDEEQKKLKKELWCREFARDDGRKVYAACRILMRDGREFAPSCGQIREKMMFLEREEALSEQDAWALVSKACKNGYYGYRKEYAKLPPDVQRAVGSPEQLREWSQMDAETVQSVVASNFMRGYRAHMTRSRELEKVPESVRALFGGIGEAKRLEGKDAGGDS